MSRARARSSCSGEVVSDSSAMRSTPSRSRLTSRRASATMMSTMADCWIGSRRPTAPKSMRPRVPSVEGEHVARMRIGVEQTDPHHLIERRLGAAGRPGRRDRDHARRAHGVGHGHAVEAFLDQHPLARQMRGRPWGREPMSARAGRPPSRPWRRPRGGSRARPEDPRRIAPASPPSAHPDRRSSAVGRGRPTAPAPPGRGPSSPRWRAAAPSRRPPRPCGAAPRRSGRSTPRRAAPNRTRRTPRRRPRPARPRAPGGCVRRRGRHAVLQLGQLVADLTRDEIDARGGDLAELDVDATGVLEDAPQADAHRVGGPLDRSAALMKGPNPRAAQPHQLSIPPQHGDAAPQGAQRPGRHDQPGPLTEGQGARAGQQVEHDGCRHRRRDANGQQVDEQLVGAPLPVVHPEGDDDGGAPADHSREQRRAPASATAQEPQRQQRGERRPGTMMRSALAGATSSRRPAHGTAGRRHRTG